MVNIRRTNTPVEENESSLTHDNNANLGAEGSLLMAISSLANIQTKRHESVHSADHAITMDVENENCSYQVLKRTRIRTYSRSDTGLEYV